MFRAFIFLFAILVSQTANAAVYLNGVNIDGVTNQVFQNCTVTIDARGNILIISQGATITPSAGGKPAVAPKPAEESKPATMTQRYWVVTEKAAPGMAQYDIDLFINSKFVRKLLDDEEQVVLEITKFLQPGDNKVVLIAKKNIKGTRRSASPQHYFRVVMGVGDSGGRNVMISKKLIDYKRTAQEMDDATEEFVLTTN